MALSDKPGHTEIVKLSLILLDVIILLFKKVRIIKVRLMSTESKNSFKN